MANIHKRRLKQVLDSSLHVNELIKSNRDSLPGIKSEKGKLSFSERGKIIADLEKNVGPPNIIRRHELLLQDTSGRMMYSGNKAALLVDGPATYRAMMKAIREAKHHIHMETYIYYDDEMGKKFGELLCAKQKEGVEVRLIYDSAGCITSASDFFHNLKKKGVHTCEFNPISPWKAKRKLLPLTYRDHRKMLIVDGKIGFIGGINVSNEYSLLLPTPKGRKQQYFLRDTHMQLEGPVVAELQRLFLESWKKQKGEVLKGNYFPKLTRKGDELVRIVGSAPEQDKPMSYLMYISAFSYARNYIYLTASYFVPTPHIMNAITSAAARGVDVRIFLPGNNDSIFAWYAGRGFYAHLLKCGVKLYERRKDGWLHAKTAVIDDVWSTVGSANIDRISFLKNDEANAVVLSNSFALKLKALFEEDIRHAKEITLEQWKKRSLLHKILERGARLFAHWL